MCDFHREQCWERWVRDQKHEVSPEDGEKLLELLRACAYAPPATEEGVPVNQFYKAAESALKESDLKPLLAPQHVAKQTTSMYSNGQNKVNVWLTYN